MRNIILVLGLLLSVSSFSQDFKVFKGDTINRKDAKGLKQGIWRKYYRTDTLCSESRFLNDKPVGISKTWYESGMLKAVVQFGKNSLRGEGISYFESGKIMAKGIYQGQQKDSIWIYYHEKADTISAIEKYKSGIPEGTWKVFYEDGVLAHELNYKKGKKEGIVKQYNMDGTLIFEINYVNGVENGLSILYYTNGKLREKGLYKNGERDGKWIIYNENGTTAEEMIYKMGTKVTPAK